VHTGIFRARQAAVFLFFLSALTFLVLRLFYLQVFRHSFYSKIASGQHTVSIEIPPKRGIIYDSKMRVLAINLNCDSIYANARLIENKPRAARMLSSVLNLKYGFVYDRIARDKSFVWIKRRVSPQESFRVKSMKIEGVEIMKESKRFYPNAGLACHALGTSNIDNVGLEGLELYYDKYLKGESGSLITQRDAKRKLLESYQREYIPPKNGLGLVLTIDEVIQHIAERELARMYEKYNARGASIIVMDPRSGDILALANLPDYDLNDAAKRPQDAIRDRAINDFFEPGSVFKIVTASAALEEKVVSLDTVFYCENGEYRIGKRILHDHTPHGNLTFKEVIEKSSNIGTVKAASRLGAARMCKYIREFGFYDKTGIDLPGEVIGMNRPLDRWSGVSMYAIPMGQEVTTTAIQLARAIAIIANNGYMVRPRVVKYITDENGHPVKEFLIKTPQRVISSETATKMRGVLMGVVKTGTGKKAAIEDYNVGGKTGTAQKVEPGGVYSHDRFMASFIGFAPVEKPVLAVVVCVDEPRPVYFGGEVAAPVFKNVVDESLKYLNAKGA
jgi:cell division protein FtsI/penicillin-binding protein 2